MDIKKTIKKNENLMKLYKKCRPIFLPFLLRTNHKLATKLLYFETFGKFPNMQNPQKFTEKLAKYSGEYYFNNPLVTQCADKYAVREFIKKRGYSNILNEIYGVWTTVEEIEWELLPDKFVLKCNHGAGFNLICHSKDEFDIEKAKAKINKWLETEYWKKSGELFYKDMEKVIYCEKFIETEDGLPPKDIKIFCSYGEPKMLFVASERTSFESVKFDYYTPEWELIPVKNVHENSNHLMSKPSNLGTLLKIASDLSKDWPQVRVDLYSEKNKIIFGELTFLHMAGRPQFEPQEYDEIFGKYFP